MLLGSIAQEILMSMHTYPDTNIHKWHYMYKNDGMTIVVMTFIQLEGDLESLNVRTWVWK